LGISFKGSQLRSINSCYHELKPVEDCSMSAITWNRETAEVYDETSASMFKPEVLDPAVDLIAELADGGPVLEFAIGTGRVALPLSARGIDVQGIELSPHMAAELRKKPGADAVPVTIGDMASTRVTGEFKLVYLVWNSIMNLTTLDEQIAVFRNAFEHLGRGGRFVVEVVVPQLRKLPPGEVARVFTQEAEHVGIETFDDLVEQISSSHHWMSAGGRLVHHSAPYRYVWPSELELMGRLAGFYLENRWTDWNRNVFVSESESQVAVFRRAA
jgi:SAM-dependent methyltransferase